MRTIVENRRIKSAVSTLCAVALVLLLCIAAAIHNARSEDDDVSAIAATAGRAFVVVLDAGHGGADGGAVGTKSGVPEAGINLTIVKYVKTILETNGVTVVLTRENEDALGHDKRTDMSERKRIMNEAEPDAIVSVHMNKFRDASVSGPMAFYMKGSAEGEKLALSIITAVCEGVGRDRRAANPGDYFVIRESPFPSAIIECGFLSNAKEEAKLLDEAYQRLLAEGIASGILGYLEARPSGGEIGNTRPAS